MGLPIFIGNVPEYKIVEDHMHIVISGKMEFVLPVSVMLAGIARAKREIDQWQRRTARVIQLRNERE